MKIIENLMSWLYSLNKPNIPKTIGLNDDIVKNTNSVTQKPKTNKTKTVSKYKSKPKSKPKSNIKTNSKSKGKHTTQELVSQLENKAVSVSKDIDKTVKNSISNQKFIEGKMEIGDIVQMKSELSHRFFYTDETFEILNIDRNTDELVFFSPDIRFDNKYPMVYFNIIKKSEK